MKQIKVKAGPRFIKNVKEAQAAAKIRSAKNFELIKKIRLIK